MNRLKPEVRVLADQVTHLTVETRVGPLSLWPVTVPLLGSSLWGTGPTRTVERLAPPVRLSNGMSLQTPAGQLEEAGVCSVDQHGDPVWLPIILALAQLNGTQESDLLVTRACAELWRRVGMLLYPHQLATAKRVIFAFHGRAILADEVGLGKTIEAGIILKEYMLRNLVNKVLILTPTSLCYQWQNELRDKFDIIASIQRTEADWSHVDVLIASIDTAKREPHRSNVLSNTYDMLIVDEAHRLKNDNTINWKFISSIRSTFCLLLTATPIQNDIKELFNLVNIVRPGLLGTWREFRTRFVIDKRNIRDTLHLREILSSVLIRHRRQHESIVLPPREVKSIDINLTAEERRFYEDVTEFVRSAYQKTSARRGNVLPLLTLQREICSTAYAAALTMRKLWDRSEDQSEKDLLEHLMSKALSLPYHSKVEVLLDLIRNIKDKVIVFTEFKASQQYIRYRLHQAGFSVLGFDGEMSSSRKGWIQELFRRQADILVSTESGGEGLNLQFCCHVINFDLPWNPMRLEQRIGRVHRLGQLRPVTIYNLSTVDSIEEYVLYLLHKKINLFRSAIGELDVILAQGALNGSLEKELMRIILETQDRTEVTRQLEELGDRILAVCSESRKHDVLEEVLALPAVTVGPEALTPGGLASDLKSSGDRA